MATQPVTENVHPFHFTPSLAQVDQGTCFHWASEQIRFRLVAAQGEEISERRTALTMLLLCIRCVLGIRQRLGTCIGRPKYAVS